MLNREINSRFEDWLLAPRETLDFEVKRWLTMTDAESQGLVAKALIALENHGGGFLLFGYRENEEKVLVPDSPRPATLQPYLADAINAILKKRAEPGFHVEVSVQRHPQTGDEYPLVRVHGTSKVPVRSDSETPAGALRNYVYYIRASGPESRGPMNAAEWDTLLRRVVSNQRDEIISLLRAFSDRTTLTSMPEAAPERESPDAIGPLVFSRRVAATEQLDCNQFATDAEKRWESLNGSLPKEHLARISRGYYAFAACIDGTSKGVKSRDILTANAAARRYTGWPVFIADLQDSGGAKLVDGCIEAWLAKTAHADPGHADFWRIHPSGKFFLLRGYQEDSVDSVRKVGEPGTLFEVTLPVWRLAEFLVRVRDLGEAMFEPGFQVFVQCKWTGIAGRRIFSHNWRRAVPTGGVSAADGVETEGTFSHDMLRDLLPETVKSLTGALYEHFDFFQPPDTFYAEEITSMLTGKF